LFALAPVDWLSMKTSVAPLTPGVHQLVGEIPNPLALAHWLTHTPLIESGAVFVILENEFDRRIVAEALPLLTSKLEVIEWTGGVFALARLQASQGIVLLDKVTLEENLLPTPSAFSKACLELIVGDQFTVADLQTLLADHGFDREPTANEPGRWAARGDVVDVFVDYPLRIQFDNGVVESISEFDLGTGAHGKQHQSVIIPPLHLRGRSSLLDHLPVDAPLVMFHQEALPTLHPQILINSVQLPDHENAGYTDARSYHLRHEELEKDLRNSQQVVLFSAYPDKARGLLDGKSIQVHDFNFTTRGFWHKASGSLVLTDINIGFGEHEQRKKQAALAQEMVQKLTPGDLVVHIYHGIGRFGGTTVMHVNKLDREYFQLEYAAGDKIYVPVELAERVDKYLGDPNPKLNRLSDASWNEAVVKVRAHTLEMARELLELYAKRTVARASQCSQQPAELNFDAACPYVLTSDQIEAWETIKKDLSQEQPMDRLLCGDVGFGKTEVALRATLRAVLNGYQVAVLAPTTILVQQHFDTFSERLKEFGVTVGQLSRFTTAKEQRAVITDLASGLVQVVVGTHRLLSKDVSCKRLGLIVIDEEQRFGVKAKEGLKRIRTSAHVLSMTATPIPRTLHLSLSGVRDVSTILTPPEERKAVELTIQPLSASTILQAVEREMNRGGQTYYLYNRVQSIEQRRLELQKLIPSARIGIAHGQMDAKTLSSVMHEFDTGNLDILLATTIIENGLDIPNANTLIVENASMFGLAELYQLKGRVGRSARQGYAFFLYTERVPEADAKKRFVALQSATELGSGFELAMKDMEIRGVGNILGQQQHGHAVKIGLHLYLRLLNQAVQEMKGMDIELERDVPIDLPIESRIPIELLPDESDRIQVYQKLAAIRDRDELNKKRAQYTKQARFGKNELHPAVAGLFDVLEVKLIATGSTLTSIDTTYSSKNHPLSSPIITIASDTPFPDTNEVWERLSSHSIDGWRVRASLEDLGNNWIEQVKTVVRLARKRP